MPIEETQNQIRVRVKNPDDFVDISTKKTKQQTLNERNK